MTDTKVYIVAGKSDKSEEQLAQICEAFAGIGMSPTIYRKPEEETGVILVGAGVPPSDMLAHLEKTPERGIILVPSPASSMPNHDIAEILGKIELPKPEIIPLVLMENSHDIIEQKEPQKNYPRPTNTPKSSKYSTKPKGYRHG